MTSSLHEWAIRWGVGIQALTELQHLFGTLPAVNPFASVEERHSEAYVQSLVRLEAARKGLKLWRNNVGALMDERGIPVRYGLANDSPALNKTIKSGDLIGWRPLQITPAHVGSVVAQFISRECKKPNWSYSASEREKAQLKWIEVVTADGGDARFVTGEGTL